MTRGNRQTPRMPATKFANLRKKMQQQKPPSKPRKPWKKTAGLVLLGAAWTVSSARASTPFAALPTVRPTARPSALVSVRYYRGEHAARLFTSQGVDRPGLSERRGE